MIIYRSRSLIQVILIFILKIGYVGVAAYSLFHYHQNPIVTVIVAAICLLFFVLTGTDELIVYEDVVEYKSANIFKFFRENKKFNITDIKSIKVDGTFDTASELEGFNNPRRSSINTVEIILKDGRITNLRTSIYIEKLKKAVSEIEKLLT